MKDSPYRDTCKTFYSGKAAGILSFGIEGGFEHIDDILADIEQALAAAK